MPHKNANSGCPIRLRCQINPVCNIYIFKSKKDADMGVRAKVSAVADKLSNSLVRKTDSGVVMLADESVEVMRWGFHRPFNPAINNARSDKLESGMWAEAWQERRCVIPVSLFYEWGPGVGGHKQAYEFQDPGGDYLWVAGIWETHPNFGPCYSMITTEASPIMEPIHHRMPAILPFDSTREFFAGGSDWGFVPFDDSLVVTPCASPLGSSHAGDSQGELF